MEKISPYARTSDFKTLAQTVLIHGRPAARVRERTDTPTRLQIALWGLLVVALLLLFQSKYSEFQIGAFQDDATYIVLAQSILQGDAYGLVNVPGAPASTQFPFGFPLLLAPWVLLFPDNLDVLRLVSLLATCVNAALLFWGWRYFSQRRSYWWALAVTGLYVLAPLVVDHSRMVMSEPVFLTFCLLALRLAEQAARREEGRLWILWMSISLLFVLFVRTVGFTLWLAVFGYLLWRRGLPYLKTLVPVVLLVGAFTALVILVTPVAPQDLVPVSYVSTAAETSADGTPELFAGEPTYKLEQHLGFFLRQLLVPLGGGDTEDQLLSQLGLPSTLLARGLVLAAIVALGFLAWIRQEGLSSFNTFALVYAGIIYFWYWDGPRFLYPIEPQLQFAFLLGIEAIVGFVLLRRDDRKLQLAGRVLVGAVIVFLLGSALYKSALLAPSTLHMGDLTVRTNWISMNTQAADIIMSEEPAIDYLLAKRKTVPLPYIGAPPTELERRIRANGVNYILLAPSMDWQQDYAPMWSERITFLLPALETLVAQKRLVRVYTSPSAVLQVYKVQPAQP